MKKIISSIILSSMLLHCAGRLGLISYVYQQRHEIAFAFGLTAEKVIAMCSSNYHEQIILTEHHANNESGALPHAQEINLFFLINEVSLTSNQSSGTNHGMSFYHSRPYNSPYPDIFHPPLV